jgi:aspartyl-tRNA(Asn)/glutamyl-tRNA(Gln) amidotransferase subunit C
VDNLAEDVDIRHIAWLARIELSEGEIEKFKRLIKAVRSLVDKLLEANVENVEPLYHPLEVEGVKREDKPSGGMMDREKALMNAARTEKGYIVAPRTIEQ